MVTEIIPDIRQLEQYVLLSQRDSLGFEYNDFFDPALLDDRAALDERIRIYRGLGRPERQDTMHGAFFDIVPFSYDLGIRNHSLYRMQQSVEIAGKLGCRGVVFHAGLNPQYIKGKNYYENWLSCMTQTIEKLTGQDGCLEIYWENVLEKSPEGFLALAERFGENRQFGICVDVAHLVLAGADVERWLSELGPYIRHFHLNDNCLETDDHFALGDGKIDWKTFFCGIRAHGLDGVSRLLEMNGLDKVERSLEYLKKLD